MRVITEGKLRQLALRHADSLDALEYWLAVARQAEWNSLADVRGDFRSADLVGDRLVFNIRGNRYRLVAAVWFGGRILWIKFFGTHAEYDKIDVRTVELR